MTARRALMLAALAAFGAAATYGAGLMTHTPVVTQSDTECDSCSARKQSQKELREAMSRTRKQGN